MNNKYKGLQLSTTCERRARYNQKQPRVISDKSRRIFKGKAIKVSLQEENEIIGSPLQTNEAGNGGRKQLKEHGRKISTMNTRASFAKTNSQE